MPSVHLIDEAFVVASPEAVRAVLCADEWWAGWLPGVSLTPYDDRGLLGVRWNVSGALVGTAEVWLEEHGDGTIVHTYLRADPTVALPRLPVRRRRFVERHYALPLKQAVFDVKDALEGDRLPGSARVPLAERVVSATDTRPSGVASDRPPKPRTRRLRRATGTGSKGVAADGRPDHLEHPDRR